MSISIGIACRAFDRAGGSEDESENIAAVSALVEQAAGEGARIILPPELFSGPYFCKLEDEDLFALARPVREHPSVLAMQALAKTLGAIPRASFRLTKRALRGPHLQVLQRHGAVIDGEVLRVWQAPDTLAAIRNYVDRTLVK